MFRPDLGLAATLITLSYLIYECKMSQMVEQWEQFSVNSDAMKCEIILDLPQTWQTEHFKTGDAVARLSVVPHLDLKSMGFAMVEGSSSTMTHSRQLFLTVTETASSTGENL